MTSNKKDPVLVVLQMTGAYDALNTFIPYSDPLYKDYRKVLKVEPEDVLAVDDKVGFHPAMAPIKDMYDQGKVAVLQGIGYPNPIRWTSGIRPSLTRWSPKAGWDGPSGTWTPTKRTS
jgi:uncharacterized protein (DUF1501 family)